MAESPVRGLRRHARLGAAALLVLAVGGTASCGDDAGAGGGGTGAGAVAGGSGGDAGDDNRGGGGAAGVGGGGDTSTGGTQACETDDNPCAECTFEACPDVYCGCATSPSCSALVVCMFECPPDDTACVQACWTAHSDGIAPAALLLHCSGASCQSDCGAAEPLGPCELCLFETCPDAMNTCLGNPDCASLIGCITACAGDEVCATQCYFDYSDGIEDATPVGECSSGPCAGACQL